MPVGSVFVRVFLIGRVIATTLKWRIGEPAGQSPSARPAYGSTAGAAGAAAEAFSPSQGAPEWPFGENGGRLPMWGRISGHAGRPFDGSNWIFGRSPVGVETICPGARSVISEPGWAALMFGRSGQTDLSSGSPR